MRAAPAAAVLSLLALLSARESAAAQCMQLPGTASRFEDWRSRGWINNVQTALDSMETNDVFHEAHGHAALKDNYYLRKMAEAGMTNLHDFIRQRSDACFQNVTPPVIGMRMAGISPVARTGAPWEPAFAILALAGMTWGVARRKGGGGTSELT